MPNYLQSKSTKFKVDVIWKALDLCSDGSQQFGQKSVLDQAEQMVECAQQNPKLFQTPRVKFALFNGLTPAVVTALQSRGVQVLGPDLVPVMDQANNSARWVTFEFGASGKFLLYICLRIC